MFNRVKAYIVILTLMNACLGVVCVFAHSSFKSPAYEVITSVLPLILWGLIFLIIAGTAVCGWIMKSLIVMRAAMTASAAVMTMWGVSFFIASLIGKAQGPTGSITWLTIAALEVVITATPGIAPIERYVEKNRF